MRIDGRCFFAQVVGDSLEVLAEFVATLIALVGRVLAKVELEAVLHEVF